jgi:hypothetical protein
VIGGSWERGGREDGEEVGGKRTKGRWTMQRAVDLMS